MSEKNHHVAWKDRVGLSDRWEELIRVCAYKMANGEKDLPRAVEALQSTLVNIRNGPQLRSMVFEYRQGELKQAKEEMYQRYVRGRPRSQLSESHKREFETQLVQQEAKLVFEFIVQMLEDYGFCFYESRQIEVDENAF